MVLNRTDLAGYESMLEHFFLLVLPFTNTSLSEFSWPQWMNSWFTGCLVANDPEKYMYSLVLPNHTPFALWIAEWWDSSGFPNQPSASVAYGSGWRSIPQRRHPHMSPCACQFYTQVTCHSNSFKNLSRSLSPLWTSSLSFHCAGCNEYWLHACFSNWITGSFLPALLQPWQQLE